MPGKQTSSYRHKQAVERLKREWPEGAPCPWPPCGRPLYVKNPALNYDGRTPQADHTVPRNHGNLGPPDRIIHGRCNARRQAGRDDLPPDVDQYDDGGGFDCNPHLIAVPW